ncbi:helix-turn-helix transcriptional regulator [bacterium]|nr:helix-turn-helix transcriptional regulator [bacterium]
MDFNAFLEFLDLLYGKHLSQNKVQKLLGISKSKFSRYKSGKADFPKEKARSFLEKFLLEKIHNSLVKKQDAEKEFEINGVQAKLVHINDAKDALCETCEKSGHCSEELYVFKKSARLGEDFVYIVIACPYYSKKEKTEIRPDIVINFLDYLMNTHPDKVCKEAINLLHKIKLGKHKKILEDLNRRLKNA